MLIFAIVVFVSILVHELGHALAFRRYGTASRIVLYHFGGLAIPEESPWGESQWRLSDDRPERNEIVISLAGPVAGFLLAAVVIGAVRLAGHKLLWEWPR